MRVKVHADEQNKWERWIRFNAPAGILDALDGHVLIAIEQPPPNYRCTSLRLNDRGHGKRTSVTIVIRWKGLAYGTRQLTVEEVREHYEDLLKDPPIPETGEPLQAQRAQWDLE